MKKKLFCKFISLFIGVTVFLSQFNVALSSIHLTETFKYKTSFGNCPAEVAGKLTLKLYNLFNKTNSLANLKKIIIKNKLAQKYYLSSYKITYSPVANILNLKLDCPRIIARVHLIKDGGIDGYDALLMSDGQVFDSTFEILVRSKRNSKIEFPYLSIPVKYFSKSFSKSIASLLLKLDAKFRTRYLSEIIVDDNKNLMFILTGSSKPTSIFLGKRMWAAKLIKMKRIYSYMKKNKKTPTIVNLTNLKKIVVKFNHSF